MTENLPAVRPEPTTMVVARDTDSWAEQLPAIVDLSRSICGTDFVPESIRNNIPATAAAMLYGREVGLPPLTALSNVNVIKGRVGLSAVIMRAQVLAAGHEIRQEESNSALCKMSGRRRGTDYWQTVTYTIEDAKLAGHTRNDQYTKNPRRMLRARATSELCELMFADVVRGMPSLEELDDLDEDTPAGTPTATPRSRVQRKSAASKTDDGAGPPADAPAAGGVSPAPSSPPLPPLPGEPGFDGPTDSVAGPAGAESQPATVTDAGAAAAAPSADGETRVPAAPASTPETDDGAAAPPAERTGAATPAAAESATSTAAPSSLPPLPGEEDLPEQAEDITDPQRKKWFALMAEHGLKTKEQQLPWISKNLGREITSRSEVNKDDAKILIDLLEQLDETPRPISRGDLRLLGGLFKELGITVVAERLHIAAAIVGRTPMKEGQPSSEGLTAAEGKTLMDALARCKTRDHVEALVQMAEQERAQDGEQDG